MSDLVESFLELYSKPRIKKEYRLALTKFFEWAELAPEQILEEWKTAADRYEFRKKWGNILVKYYNYHLERGVKINTALGYVTPMHACIPSSLMSFDVLRPPFLRYQSTSANLPF